MDRQQAARVFTNKCGNTYSVEKKNRAAKETISQALTVFSSTAAEEGSLDCSGGKFDNSRQLAFSRKTAMAFSPVWPAFAWPGLARQVSWGQSSTARHAFTQRKETEPTRASSGQCWSGYKCSCERRITLMIFLRT